jgi:hypothetical protein
MKVRSNVKAGGFGENHNEKMTASKSLTVKTGVKAGGIIRNHNEKMVSDN